MDSNNENFEKIDGGLGDMFYRCMKQNGNRIAQYIADTDETDTYAELLSRCIRTSLTLVEKGIGSDDIISSCTHNHKNACVPLIASQFLGVKSANFDPDLSHLDTVRLLLLIQPRIMFVAQESVGFMEKCLRKANTVTELVVFGHSDKYSQFSEYTQQRPRKDEENFTPFPIKDIKSTAVILFSSGTTGFPKGICLSHYCLLKQTNLGIFSSVNDDGSSSVMLLHSTFYWISGILSLIQCFTCCYSKVICAKFDAVDTWKIIEKFKVTLLYLAPYHAIEFLAQRPDQIIDTNSLDVLFTGSAPVTKKLMEDLKQSLPKTTILHGYGQTEAGGMVTIFNKNNPEEIELQDKKPQSCGRILPQFEWKIVDITTDEVLGPNRSGELRLKSDCLMNGYYKMDSSSAFDQDGYLKTGDIAFYDEDYCFYIKDRIKEMFKYRGWHILPAILEEVLMSHFAVKEAAVVGIPHEKDGDHPMGIVVLHDGYQWITAQDLELFVEKQVSDSQRLRAGVKIVTEIPRTCTGKIKRNAVKEMALKNEI